MRALICGLLLALPGAGQVDVALLDKLAAQYHPSERAFSFAAIGDQQYGAEGERKWPALVESINKRSGELKFVVHVGDFKSGGSPCTDAVFQNRLDGFNQFKIPFIVTPGDNEWTDCHRTGGDPVERLAKLRQMFFAGGESLGQKKRALTREKGYPENALWTEGGLVFATLHIVGSDNNYGQAEYAARNNATLDWMRTAFALAKRNGFAGVVVALQADPFFPLYVTKSVQKLETTPGFVDTLRVMEEETVAFGKPVLVINGDSHFFRFDKPMAHKGSNVTVDNFFRLEVPGDQDVHWVRVDVDPEAPESPFRIQHMTVKANAR